MLVEEFLLLKTLSATNNLSINVTLHKKVENAY